MGGDDPFAGAEMQLFESEPEGELPGSLAARFGMPPFSVFDARQGYWQGRKRAWIALGIQSELGRGEFMVREVRNGPAQDTQYYRRQRKVGALEGGNHPLDQKRRYDAENKNGLLGFSEGARTGYKEREREKRAAEEAAAIRRAGANPTMEEGEYEKPEGRKGGGANGMMGYTGGKGKAQAYNITAWMKEHQSELSMDAGTPAMSGTSIFDPVLTEALYRWFSPPGGLVLDPFAGGSVRGVVAAKLGRRYVGIDLRPEQVEANRMQAEDICANDPTPLWHAADSLTLPAIWEACEYEPADFILTCPPYADLEIYSDDPRDISTMEYPEFLRVYREIVAAAAARLHPDRFAAIVVGDIRDKAGLIRPFVNDTIAAFEAAGLRHYNDAVLLTAVGSLPIRVKKQMEASRKLGRTHQRVLVFVKGDPQKAAKACGDPEAAITGAPAEAVAKARAAAERQAAQPEPTPVPAGNEPVREARVNDDSEGVLELRDARFEDADDPEFGGIGPGDAMLAEARASAELAEGYESRPAAEPEAMSPDARLAEIDALMDADPEPDTPAGRRLAALAAAQEAYEDEAYPALRAAQKAASQAAQPGMFEVEPEPAPKPTPVPRPAAPAKRQKTPEDNCVKCGVRASRSMLRERPEGYVCRFGCAPPPPPSENPRDVHAARLAAEAEVALTPVERGPEGIWIKRDDKFVVGGAPGGKARTCLRLAQAGTGALVTAGTRGSPQVHIVALIAAHLGREARVHVPKATETYPEVSLATRLGARVFEHTPGYNTVISARAREDAEETGGTHIPFGMECREATEETAAQVANLPPDTERIVVPVGSGMSLAGILWGLQRAGRDTPVLGVMVGASPLRRLERFAPPGWEQQVDLVEAGQAYGEHAPVTTWWDRTLDPFYEAKAAPFCQPGDLFWVVGIRPRLYTPPAEPEPERMPDAGYAGEEMF